MQSHGFGTAAPVATGAAPPPPVAALAGAAAEAPKTRKPRAVKASKKLTDPERPKKPLTQWVRFLAHYRASLTEKLPPTEVLKRAAVVWRDMSEVEKWPFEESYQAEKAEYDKAFQEYVESGKKEAWTRDPEKPKKPLTGFFRYMEEFRGKNLDVKGPDMVHLAAEGWRGLGESGREPYERAYKAEMEAYNVAMKAYKESGKEAAWKEKVGLKAEEDKETKKLALQKARLEAATAKTVAQAAKLRAKMAVDKEKIAKKKAEDKAKAAELKKEEAKKVAEKLAAAKEKMAAKKAA